MTHSIRVCLATQNQHKVVELRQLLRQHAPALATRIELVSLADLGISDEVVEDGADFSDNALKKAQAAHALTGLWALADDSGLVVRALGGAPGVHSARYGGQPAPGQSVDARNREAVLAALRDIPASERQARFVCVLCLYGEPAAGAGAAGAGARPQTVLRRGVCNGTLLTGERGEGGFGYDSLFVPTAEELAHAHLDPSLAGRTYAELTAEQKNSLSHRTRALIALLPTLEALAAGQPLE